MALSVVAQKRNFENVWVCMKCNAKNKGQKGVKPDKCRKCNSKSFRLKKKGKKKAG